MLFNSLAFLAFVMVVLVVHHGVLRGAWAAQRVFLLVASWTFYASWSPTFLLLLIATTWIDFHLAHRIHAERTLAPARARLWLVVSVGLNLGLLGFFKYGAFAYGAADALVGLPPLPDLLRMAAPLGISFYTFHSISYLVDTHRGLRPPTDRFVDYALYVAFFPQLIAGPIMRWGFFGPQLESARTVRAADVDRACFLLAVGFVKKVVCADALGAYVDDVYAAPGHTGTVECWIALYAYAFQIYFDFSGYTDIAQGVAGLLGFRLPPNFDHPYLATDPAEFWRRWHISLSTWLRDYLYIPLGGNRGGAARTYANLMATMLLGGLWHGAAWTFVAWGGFHGAWLAAHRAITRDGRRPPRTPRWLRRFITFHLAALAWIPFRAPSFATAATLLSGLVQWRAPWSMVPLDTLALIAIGVATHALALGTPLSGRWTNAPWPVRGMVYAATVLAVGLCSAQTGRFIYFAF